MRLAWLVAIVALQTSWTAPAAIQLTAGQAPTAQAAAAQDPAPPRLTIQPPAPLRLTHRARAVKPGEILEIAADPWRPVERIEVSGLGPATPMWTSPTIRGWRGLIGIDVDHEPGPIRLTFTSTDRRGTRTTTTYPLLIEPATFAERHLRVAPRFVTPPPAVRARIEREAARLQAIYAGVSTDRPPDLVFAPPVPHRRSSPFGSRSVFNGVPRSRHAGLDFASPAGAVIRAPGDGRVVLVDALYYTGNTVVVDHGRGLVSIFAHLQRMAVKAGDVVSRGARLGTVGATGRATGPHLHWSVRLGGARVDPAAVLELLAPVAP